MERDKADYYVENDTLALYGENISRSLNFRGWCSGRSSARRIADDLRVLKKQRDTLERRCAVSTPVPSAAEWLLDNFYLAQREGLRAAALLRCAGNFPASGGESALFSLCISLLRAGNGSVTKERCGIYLGGCQLVHMLSRRELSCFVPLLKAAAISELRKLYEAGTFDEAAAISAGNLFSTLRLLSTVDLSKVLEAVDMTERTLAEDPAEVYPLMAEKTRDAYKRQVERLARKYRTSERRVAERALALAQNASGEAAHVGYWLFTKPMGREKARPRGTLYIWANLLGTFFLSLFAAHIFETAFVFLLLLLPLSELVKNLIDMLVLTFLRPAHVPRMELKNGVPPEGRTVCVISALLTDEGRGPVLARRLEEFRLASRDCGENLLFGVLADLPDADSETAQADAGRIDALKAAIDALNRKYDGGFFFFIRPRRFCRADGRYMAWERKRGAVSELAALLSGRKSSVEVPSGSLLALRGVRYILTLDEDTRLTPGTARELIGAMLHPLNRPQIDPETRVVRAGHGLLHPRISPELSSCGKSRFAEIFAGQGGLDPYGSDSSELYMDAFDNGGFAGKGILDAEAFCKCMDGRIPPNRVLSHDALEGAFLRGGYVGDIELTDKFPSDTIAYYKRLHRWTRGDWQNLPWLFKRGRCLTPIDRWRLFDSARRSLVAPFTLAAFFFAFFLPLSGYAGAALLALLALAFHLIVSAVEVLFRDEDEVHLHFESEICHGVSGALRMTGAKLLFLPFEAWVCLSAALTALWRMGFSRRKLLEWTPASVFESSQHGIVRCCAGMWPCPLAGAALCFASSLPAWIAGIVWIFSPWFGFLLSRRIVREVPVSPEDRTYLLACARNIWSFFEDFCTPQEHWLPPDNWQERPPTGVAHRTSPTNIGLCLLSCLSAADLGIAKPESAVSLMENILNTLASLQKWNGHLYNWYDTRTLAPLHPAYVSTVDSGNLAVCLVIAREGLLEHDRADLAQKCDELLAPMSFAPLYDRSHHLFSVGFDLEKNALTNSCYDLMASEARTAGFYAVAHGDVPRRHWRALSRAMVAAGCYRGMVSWTGSMFEYLMPCLFFRSVEGSLLWETDRFAVRVQRADGEKRKYPWGVSESAFFALDPALSYRYKAHGCAPLALKRGMGREYVTAPYASFLALCTDVHPAVKNLRALETLGAAGKYGFCEAVDFTDSRVSSPGGEIVDCVMAHHLGMSLVAICNALCADIMPHRLLRDPAMAAYSCLLEEKLPLGGVLLSRTEKSPPEAPPRAGAVCWTKGGRSADPCAPECALLSNGDYALLMTDSGASSAQFRGLVPYLPADENQPGFALYLHRDGALLPLCGQAAGALEYAFSLSQVTTTFSAETLTASITTSVSAASSGEKRVVSLRVSGEAQICELIVVFKPVLAKHSDYESHPAFFNLGLFAQQRGTALLLRRLARNSLPETHLCFAATQPMELSARADLLPGRGGLEAALDAPFPPLGWLSSALVVAKVPLHLTPEISTSVTFALALGQTEKDAFEAAHHILAADASDVSDWPADLAAALSLSEAQLAGGMELLKELAFPAVSSGAPSRSELWRFGISGDLPLLVREVQNGSEDSQAEAETLIRQHAYLCSLNRPFDLVFLTDEGGDYLRAASTALAEKKRELGGDSSLIHIIDRASGAEMLLLSAVHPRRPAPFSSEPQLFSLPLDAPSQHFPLFQWNDDGSFSFRVDRSLPPRAWSNILTNGRFGYLASDCGTGHMWFQNAREYRVNRWLCDPLANEGSETLFCGGESLFASPLDRGCSVRFGFGFAEWRKTLDGTETAMTAFVPPDCDARVLVVRWSGEKRDFLWSNDLVLCGDDRFASKSRIHLEDGVFQAENSESPFPNYPLRICSSAEISEYTTDRHLWQTQQLDSKTERGGFLGVHFTAESPFVLVCGCDDKKRLLKLCKSSTALEALKSTAVLWRKTLSAVEIETPLPALNRLVNGWLPYQALACRLMGRTSLYQSGGAVGFRDQLQDAVNLILVDSSLAKSQLLDCCRHQYLEGDVMHWWHPLETGSRGVRTRCSDDLLWLPWALCEYVEKSGETDFCSISVPFLRSDPLAASEHDRYEAAVPAGEAAAVLAHAQRALDLVLARGTGTHGLLLLGGGDWNDGMDRAGAQGHGESVWLSWFFSHTAHRFASLLRRLGGDGGAATRYDVAAAEIGRAANDAWDGGWYLRGWHDDGSPIGSAQSTSCQIDLISQSFAALSPEADPARVSTALSAAVSRLFDADHKLIKLFDPPFEDEIHAPGYIESYGPGFRENGGQYTHGAVWLVMALLRQGRTDEALPLLEALLPADRNQARYAAEPYVLSADVYANPDCAGTAGWSWYTGSAGWLWRVVLEDLLGLRFQNGEWRFSPHLPSSWTSCTVTLREKNGEKKAFLLRPDGTFSEQTASAGHEFRESAEFEK